MFFQGCDQRVDVVWHYDVFVQPIARSVEEPQRVFYDLLDCRFGQNAGTVPRVEPALKAFSEALIEFSAYGLVVRLGVCGQPEFALLFPLRQLCLRQGISESEGDEERVGFGFASGR